MCLGLCGIDDWYDEQPSPAIRAQIPAWLWLYAGDQYNILVEDVQKAMSLWACNERKISQETIQRISIELIDEWIGKDASAGTRAVKQALCEVYEHVQMLGPTQFYAPLSNGEYPRGLQEVIDNLQHSLDEILRFSKHIPVERVADIKQQMQYLI